jgi:hypothetical protein
MHRHLRPLFGYAHYDSRPIAAVSLLCISAYISCSVLFVLAPLGVLLPRVVFCFGMAAGSHVLAFPWLRSLIFLQAVYAIYPHDVTPVTNIIATTTVWDQQLPLMVDLMRVAEALFFSVRQGGC